MRISDWSSDVCSSDLVAAVPPCRCLLAYVGSALRHAETLNMAHRPVRYLAPAPHQDRCPCRRNEDLDPCPMAHRLSQPADRPACPRSYPSPRYLTNGPGPKNQIGSAHV